jgi:hypothetical protein
MADLSDEFPVQRTGYYATPAKCPECGKQHPGRYNREYCCTACYRSAWDRQRKARGQAQRRGEPKYRELKPGEKIY